MQVIRSNSPNGTTRKARTSWCSWTSRHRAMRATFLADVVARTARRVFIPLTVGGGIRSVADARKIILAGADKVSVNTAAVRRPELIRELSLEFGAQAVVLAIDARRSGPQRWNVFTKGGRQDEGMDAVEWARARRSVGAQEKSC